MSHEPLRGPTAQHDEHWKGKLMRHSSKDPHSGDTSPTVVTKPPHTGSRAERVVANRRAARQRREQKRLADANFDADQALLDAAFADPATRPEGIVMEDPPVHPPIEVPAEDFPAYFADQVREARNRVRYRQQARRESLSTMRLARCARPRGAGRPPGRTATRRRSATSRNDDDGGAAGEPAPAPPRVHFAPGDREAARQGARRAFTRLLNRREPGYAWTVAP